MLNLDYKHKFLVACNTCRKNKTKCDRNIPCSLCTKKGFSCVYSADNRMNTSLKRFYDSASSNLLMFKVESPNTKVSKIHSDKPRKLKIRLKEFPSPPLSSQTSDSNQYTSPSLSPEHLSLPKGLYFPLLKTVEPSDLSMENMVDDLDKWLFSKTCNKFEIGIKELNNDYIIKPCCNNKGCQDNSVTIKGLDFVPFYLSKSRNISGINQILILHLVNLYFNQINIFFPIISRKRFFKSLSHSINEINPFLLNAICFVASHLLSSFPLYFNGCRYELGQYYHSKALDLLDENIKNPTISSLQGLLLLYNGECALVERFNNIQKKMVRDLGLFELYKLDLDKEELEEARNLARCCFLQDKICNLTRGRSFNLSKLGPHLDLDLTHNTITPYNDFFKGSSFCHTCFIASVQLAEIIESINNDYLSVENNSKDAGFFVQSYEKKLSKIYTDLTVNLDDALQSAHSNVALLIFRLYYHMATIYLIMKTSVKFPSTFSNELGKKAFTSACSITFLVDSLGVDFFKYSTILKCNSYTLSFGVHQAATMVNNESYRDIGSFGKERAVTCAIRSARYLFGINLLPSESMRLITEFSPPYPTKLFPF